MGAEFSAEQRLQLYALTDAIGFLRHEDYGRETLAWVLDDAPDATFSFAGICDSLGYDAGHLRSRLLGYLAGGEPLPYIRGEEVVDIVAVLHASGKEACAAGHAFTVESIFISFDLHGPQIRCRECNKSDSAARHKERERKEREEFEKKQGSLFAPKAQLTQVAA